MIFIRAGKFILAFGILITILTVTVASQLLIGNSTNSSQRDVISNINNIQLIDQQDCRTDFYNQTDYNYRFVTEERSKYSTCHNYLNGSDYDCIIGTEPFQYSVPNGTILVLKNKTICESKNRFLINIGSGIERTSKELDFSNWGVCVNSTENGCLSITCGTLNGGSARNGIFNGCDNGKSCQKFLFCGNEIKILYKSSSSDFVEKDPSFNLQPLELIDPEK